VEPQCYDCCWLRTTNQANGYARSTSKYCKKDAKRKSSIRSISQACNTPTAPVQSQLSGKAQAQVLME
jgi:hypothetical protein